LAKIFKLLVGEFNDHLESALASAQDNGEQSGPDDSDEEWEDEESESPTKQMDSNGKNWKQIELSRLLSTNGSLDEEEDDEEEDDPDVISDPLYRINLRQYLTELISEFSKQPYFSSHFAPHLNVMEKKALTSIGIQC